MVRKNVFRNVFSQRRLSPFVCFCLFLLTVPALAQVFAPGTTTPPDGHVEPSEPLLDYRTVSQQEMDSWPIDSVRSGEKLWAETTWGNDDAFTKSHTLFKRHYNYNIWPNRVVFSVKNHGDVARGEAFWRRSKLSIRVTGLKLVDAQTGKNVSDARLVQYCQEKIVIDFKPVSGPGTYFLYYCALEEQLFNPSQVWLDKVTSKNPIQARAERIESRCALDSFYPMETIPLKTELGRLLSDFPDAPYLVFPQDRDFSIRMVHEIPASWALRDRDAPFLLEADRHEYRVFQLGIWACREPLDNITLSFSDFKQDSGNAMLPSGLFQCLSLTSNIKNPDINRSVGPFQMMPGQVLPLWCGIDLPEDVSPGIYHGTVSVKSDTFEPTIVTVTVKISNTVVKRRGDHDPHRLSRLRWLESDIGIHDSVFQPFTPLKVSKKSNSVSTWGHTLILNEYGMPECLRYKGTDILAAPICLDFNGQWEKPEFSFDTISEERITWRGTARLGDVTLHVNGNMEYEGRILLDISITSKSTGTTIRNLSFTTPWRKEHAELIAGLGYKGKRNKKFICGFGATSLWMGSMKAGLSVSVENIPFSHQSDLDTSTVTEEEDSVVFRLNMGDIAISDSAPVFMRFTLRPTPVKPEDSRHWDFRYLHMSGHPVPADDNTPQSYLKDDMKRLDELIDLGVTQLNLHDWWGPSFNYPWQWDGPGNLTQLTAEGHKRGLKVKVYNSGRELSSTSPEFWALVWEGTHYTYNPDIDPEPYTKYRDAWTISHLPDGIPEGWPRVHEMGNEHAVPIDMGSRLGNFYLEGIRYMLEFFDVDGVYSDGAVTRRDIARRLRNIFNEYKPDATIDVHGSAFGYLNVLPFIDSVWNGESIRYDTLDPWTWLVEVSGLPFGIPSEMVTGEQYMDRGMLFGIWPRMGWGSGTDRQQKLWAFFDRFGIQDAEMRGWWEEKNGVYANNQDIYVTVFVHPSNGVLLSVANWHSPLPKWIQILLVELKLDRKALGLPEGPLYATDILTGEELDFSKPVPFYEPKEHILSVFPEYSSFIKPFFEGRIIWVRGK